MRLYSVVMLYRKMKILLFLILLLNSANCLRASSFQDSMHIEIKDSTLYINDEYVAPDSILKFFEREFGSPDRKKRGIRYNWREYSYDDLGIAIFSREKSITLTFQFQRIIKRDPKNNFIGTIKINGVGILQSQNITEIKALMPLVDFDELFGTIRSEHFSIDQGRHNINGLQDVSYFASGRYFDPLLIPKKTSSKGILDTIKCYQAPPTLVAEISVSRDATDSLYKAAIFQEDATRNINNCQNGDKKYYYEEYSSDSLLVCNGAFKKNNKPKGLFVFYYANGEYKAMGEFNSKGQKKGIWLYYNNKGVLERQLKYK